MTDGVIKGTGNSRFLKGPPNAKTLYPTFDAFMDAYVAGTLPFDLNGINPSGWEQEGTPLNKANLLSDTTATSLSLPAENANVNNAFMALLNKDSEVLKKASRGSAVFTSSGTFRGADYNLEGTIAIFGILISGGGGGGGGGAYRKYYNNYQDWDNGYGGGGGGSGDSGKLVLFSKIVSAAQSIPVTIGLGGPGGPGGDGGLYASDAVSTNGVAGGTGGSTSFGSYITVPGGGYGGGGERGYSGFAGNGGSAAPNNTPPTSEDNIYVLTSISQKVQLQGSKGNSASGGAGALNTRPGPLNYGKGGDGGAGGNGGGVGNIGAYSSNGAPGSSGATGGSGLAIIFW